MAMFKLFLIALVLVLAGCEKAPEQTATENTIEQAAEAVTTVDVQQSVETVTETDAKVDLPVDVSREEISITGGAGEEKFTISSGDGAEIPEGFPSDVYIYSSSSVTSVMDMPEGSSIGLTTADDVSTVAETYKREMASGSWSEKSAVEDGTALMLVFEKEARVTRVTITPMGAQEGAQIDVTVTKE